MAKSTHRLGVIGLGSAARALLPRLATDPRFEIASCWDPSDEAINTARDKIPDLRTAFSVDEVFRYADVLYVASPPSSHLDYIRQALAANKPVFCEAPLALDVEGAQALGETLAAQDTPAAIAFNFTQAVAPALQLIKETISLIRFGKLLTAEVQVACAHWPREAQKSSIWLLKRGEGGVTREIVSHQLFVLRRLLGALEVESCRIGYPADARFAETLLEARLRAGDIPVILSAQAGGKVHELIEIAFQGKTEGFRLQNWFDLARFRNGMWHGVDFGAGVMQEKVYGALIDNLDMFYRGQPHGLATFAEALDVQVCVEQMLATAEPVTPPKKPAIR